MEYYREYRANVGRGLYSLSQRATEEFDEAHKKIADFIHARSSSEIAMVRGTTEGLNLVANGIEWKKGDKIVTTLLEHHSNFLSWLRVKKKCNVDLELVRPDSKGILELSEFEKKIDDRTRVVTVSHASNVLGVIQDIEAISKIAHEHGALLAVDGAQTVPSMETDVRRMDCDFLAFSGHKMCGPTGSGALYIKEEIQDEIEPLNLGGGPVVRADSTSYSLAKGAVRFEAGTPAIAEAIGMGAAVDYIRRIGISAIENHERDLSRKIFQGLSELPSVKIYGPEPDLKIGVTSFNIGTLNPHDVALALDTSANIAVRSGNHCAQPLMREILGLENGTVRSSTYIYNTEEEISKFLAMVAEISSSIG